MPSTQTSSLFFLCYPACMYPQVIFVLTENRGAKTSWKPLLPLIERQKKVEGNRGQHQTPRKSSNLLVRRVLRDHLQHNTGTPINYLKRILLIYFGWAGSSLPQGLLSSEESRAPSVAVQDLPAGCSAAEHGPLPVQLAGAILRLSEHKLTLGVRTAAPRSRGVLLDQGWELCPCTGRWTYHGATREAQF